MVTSCRLKAQLLVWRHRSLLLVSVSLTKVNVDGGTVTSAWVLTFIDFMQCLIFKLIQWDRNAKNVMSGSAELDGNMVILESTPSLRLVPTCTVPSWYLL